MSDADFIEELTFAIINLALNIDVMNIAKPQNVVVLSGRMKICGYGKGKLEGNSRPREKKQMQPCMYTSK
jgi:hypothetical protein